MAFTRRWQVVSDEEALAHTSRFTSKAMSMRYQHFDRKITSQQPFTSAMMPGVSKFCVFEEEAGFSPGLLTLTGTQRGWL